MKSFFFVVLEYKQFEYEAFLSINCLVGFRKTDVVLSTELKVSEHAQLFSDDLYQLLF